MELASRSFEELAVIWTRKVDFFFSGPHLKLVKKTVSILVKTLFFSRDHLRFYFGKDLLFLFLEITQFWPEKPFLFW